MPTIDLSAAASQSAPASITVVSTKPRVLNKTYIPAGTSTLVDLGKSIFRWKAWKQFLAYKKAGEMDYTASAPTITSLSASTVVNDNTTVITITGTGFETTATVFLVDSTNGNGTELQAGNVTRVSATSITFTVPASVAPDVYYVRVTDATVDVIASTKLTVTQYPAIAVTSYTPGTVANDNTTAVTVTGTNIIVGSTAWLVNAFTPGVQVALGNVTRVGATSLTFTVPNAVTPGYYNVVLSDGITPATVATLLAVTPHA